RSCSSGRLTARFLSPSRSKASSSRSRYSWPAVDYGLRFRVDPSRRSIARGQTPHGPAKAHAIARAEQRRGAAATGTMSAGISGLGSISAMRRAISRLARKGALDHLGVARASEGRRDHQEAGDVDFTAGDDAAELRCCCTCTRRAALLDGRPRLRSCAARMAGGQQIIHGSYIHPEFHSSEETRCCCFGRADALCVEQPCQTRCRGAWGGGAKPFEHERDRSALLLLRRVKINQRVWGSRMYKTRLPQ